MWRHLLLTLVNWFAQLIYFKCFIVWHFHISRKALPHCGYVDTYETSIHPKFYRNRCFAGSFLLLLKLLEKNVRARTKWIDRNSSVNSKMFKPFELIFKEVNRRFLHTSLVHLKGHAKWQNVKHVKAENDRMRQLMILKQLRNLRLAATGKLSHSPNKRLPLPRNC